MTRFAGPRVLLGVAVLSVALSPLAALVPRAPAEAAADAFVCRWAEGPLRIDGEADEPDWQRAPVIENFGLPWLGKNARPARTATRARLLWDRENLYFLAELEDRDFHADIREHDGRTWENDAFELFLKPAEDRPGYYEFHVTPAGTVLDMFLPSRGTGGYDRYRADGEFHLEKTVKLRGTLARGDRDEGWTVEGRIPWSDLLRTGGRPEPGESWKFALCRYDYSAEFGERPELSTNAPLTQGSFHRYEDFLPLRFAGPEKPAALAGWTPVTTSRVAGSPDPPPLFRAKRVYPSLKLAYPVMTVHVPGSDQMLGIIQQWPGGPSKVIRFRDAPDVSTYETLLELDRTAYDITFHPDFARNSYLYLGSKGPLAAPQPERKMRISRYTLAGGKLDPASELPVIEWPSDGHDGGAMVFGLDGMLYITTGDGTSDSDTHIVGQDMTRLTAKLLRIDVDRPDPGRAYSVPKDNPFVRMKDVRPETWAFGFRNPWRMALDRKTGHIWVGNNGQDQWEQAYLIKKGANYGWSVYEGSHPFYANRKLGPAPLTKPTVEHPHSEARSLTGGLVYYGERFPELRGAYIYGDYSTGKIWAVRHDGKRKKWHREIADTTLQITGFAADPRGEILIADNRGNGEGGFYTLEPTPKDVQRPVFPRRLSESGLFRSVRGHEVQPGLIPYSVNAQLWSDGAHKERFLALTSADAKIEVTPARGWSFPDGTVLVKSFALETEEGNPASRRWIETRFLTRQDGEWIGYSYRWNEQQTDAELVGAKGEDRTYRIRVPRSAAHPDGIRKQVWHYPTRAECMSCHTRAANFVLGLNTLQMNRLHDYGGTRKNQLEVLEQLGVLRVNYPQEAQDALREEARARGMTEEQANAYLAKQAASSGQRQAGQSTLLTRGPERIPRLADPYDPKADLDQRARSYLHSNCASCHVEAGGGNAQMELEWTTPADRMRVLDVKPLHDTFGIRDPRLIAPGDPDRSVLLGRISNRDRGHMPPLATSRVNTAAVELLREWIRRMPRANLK